MNSTNKGSEQNGRYKFRIRDLSCGSSLNRFDACEKARASQNEYIASDDIDGRNSNIVLLD